MAGLSDIFGAIAAGRNGNKHQRIAHAKKKAAGYDRAAFQKTVGWISS